MNTERAAAQDARRLERADQMRRANDFDHNNSTRQRELTLAQRDKDQQDAWSQEYTSFFLELRRAQSDLDEANSKAAQANSLIRKYEILMAQIVAAGYIVPTPIISVAPVVNKVSPTPAPAITPEKIGEAQRKYNAEHFVAEKPSEMDCPQCGKRVKMGIAYHGNAEFGTLCVLDALRAFQAGAIGRDEYDNLTQEGK